MTMLKPDQAKEYAKIPTLFVRGEDFQFKAGNDFVYEGLPNVTFEFTKPEFYELKHFEVTEKIDGTNVRVHLENGEFFYGGKSDSAEIPWRLLERMKYLFERERIKEMFEGKKVTFFGEGFGEGIQNKVGPKYSSEPEFILYDIYIDGFWLSFDNVRNIGAQLNIRTVPRLGLFTIAQIVDMCFKGFPSIIGNLPICEGIVAKSPSGLFDRTGERIIFKLKYKDFQKLKFQKNKDPKK